MNTVGIYKLLSVVARLRHPQTGCPWDLKQTHLSLRRYLLEEAYEAVEAIDSGNAQAIAEELGDVLLQVALHAQLAAEAGTFDFNTVAGQLADKLIRRHPHVFAGTLTADTPDQVTQNWQAIKAAEKPADTPTSVLGGITRGQPALSRALKTSQKAVAVGFEWPDFESLWRCVLSEFDEFRAEVEGGATPDRLEDELGDCLFATVNLARQFNIDPEVALSRATDKFTKRFQTMESMAPGPLTDLDFETWDTLWNQAKQQSA